MLHNQKSSRKRWYIGTFLLVIVIGAVAGFTRLGGSSGEIDPGKLVTAETGTMVRSVVATGKIEPMTKVEIKSKANGIIEALPVDVDGVPDAPVRRGLLRDRARQDGDAPSRSGGRAAPVHARLQ